MQSTRKNVSCSQIHGFFEKIVFQDDEASINGASIGDDVFPVVKNTVG